MSHFEWHIGPLGLFLNFFGVLDAVWLIKRIESETVVVRGEYDETKYYFQYLRRTPRHSFEDKKAHIQVGESSNSGFLNLTR